MRSTDHMDGDPGALEARSELSEATVTGADHDANEATGDDPSRVNGSEESLVGSVGAMSGDDPRSRPAETNGEPVGGAHVGADDDLVHRADRGRASVVGAGAGYSVEVGVVGPGEVLDVDEVK
jgi:hypothetical protein